MLADDVGRWRHAADSRPRHLSGCVLYSTVKHRLTCFQTCLDVCVSDEEDAGGTQVNADTVLHTHTRTATTANLTCVPHTLFLSACPIVRAM